MTAYYKTIKGKKYDKALLDLADSLTKSRGDGRLSQKDSQSIFKKVKDGGTYTDIEKQTIAYIRDKYTFTETGNKWFRTEIKKWAALKKKAAPPKTAAKTAVKTTAAKKTSAKKTTAKKTTAKKTTAKKTTAKKTTAKKTAQKRSAPQQTTPVKQPDIQPEKTFMEPEDFAPYDPRISQPEKKSSGKTGLFLSLFLLIALVIAGYWYFMHYKKPVEETVTKETEEKKTDMITDEKPIEEKENEVAEKKEKDPRALDLEKTVIYFSKNLGWLSPKQRVKLQPIITYLKENIDSTIVITGHSCSLGDKFLNKGLALYRAQKTAQYLQKMGIDQQRMSTRTKIHLSDDQTESEAIRAKNRRVEFEIQ